MWVFTIAKEACSCRSQHAERITPFLPAGKRWLSKHTASWPPAPYIKPNSAFPARPLPELMKRCWSHSVVVCRCWFHAFHVLDLWNMSSFALIPLFLISFGCLSRTPWLSLCCCPTVFILQRAGGGGFSLTSCTTGNRDLHERDGKGSELMDELVFITLSLLSSTGAVQLLVKPKKWLYAFLLCVCWR